jgi:hypothetical protein
MLHSFFMNLPATLFLFLVLTTHLHAQDLFLPISTPSENARFHYEQGMLRAYNADFKAFDQSMNRALQIDSSLFMVWYQKAIFATYFGDQVGFDTYSAQALRLTEELNPAERQLRGNHAYKSGRLRRR